MFFKNTVFKFLDEAEHATRRQVDLQLLIDTREALVTRVIRATNSVEIPIRNLVKLDMQNITAQDLTKVQEIL